mmetsp:Transcript_2156/g.2819  ORF Transcript_2156/g.2819 Transcript_2156/m.2819 type:complete len:358 (+) Transcript_2156:343-1416(+)
MFVQGSRLELGGWMIGQLWRNDLVATLQELCEVVEDFAILRSDHRSCQSCLVRSACSSDTVGVVLDGLGHIEIDDLHHSLDIETSASDIGGDQDVVPSLLERVHGPFSLFLSLATVNRANTVASVVQRLGQHIDSLLLVDKDDDRRLRTDQELLQTLLLLRFADELQALFDVLLGVPRITNANDGRTSQEGPCHSLDGRWHRGAEHLGDSEASMTLLCFQLLGDGLLFLLRLHVGAGNGEQHASHIVFEAQVNHLVGLINHNVVALIEDSVTLVQSIGQSTRSGQADFGTLAKCEGLLLRVAATDNTDHSHSVAVGCELLRFLFDLQHQLTAWSQYDRVGSILGRSIGEWWQLLDVG